MRRILAISASKRQLAGDPLALYGRDYTRTGAFM